MNDAMVLTAAIAAAAMLATAFYLSRRNVVEPMIDDAIAKFIVGDKNSRRTR
jgi:hypothetical protein